MEPPGERRPSPPRMSVEMMGPLLLTAAAAGPSPSNSPSGAAIGHRCRGLAVEHAPPVGACGREPAVERGATRRSEGNKRDAREMGEGRVRR